MKLKLVVASMSVLGLVSCPAFADTTQQPKHKIHHTHMVRHHHMVSHNYKAEGGLVQPVPMVEACPVDMFQSTMAEMSQNTGRAVPTDCKPISFAGGMNFDAHFGNLSQGYQGENNERLSLNDAYLNMRGNVNDWTKAFASLSYNNVSGASSAAGNAAGTGGSTNGNRQFILVGSQYSNVYPVNTLTLEQGYIQFADFDMSPVFVQLGKQFADYNRYEIHPITRTMTQVLTETLRTEAEVGFVTHMGLNGSLYAFDNPLKKQGTDTHSHYTYGASLGFDQPSDQLGYGLGIGYLTNMTGVNDVAGAVNSYRTTFNTAGGVSPNNTTTGVYNNKVSSIALYGHVNSGPFYVGLNYTTALQRFNAFDLRNKLNGATGAKPWAADVKVGYGYNAWGKNQNIYVGYQTSNDTVYLGLPSNRWLAGLGVDMWKNTNLGVEVNHDTAYSISNGGTGNSSNTVALRAAVKFG